MISYLDGTCRLEIEPIQKTEQLEEDVPLCSFEQSSEHRREIDSERVHPACVCSAVWILLLSRCGGRKGALSGVAD